LAVIAAGCGDDAANFRLFAPQTVEVDDAAAYLEGAGGV